METHEMRLHPEPFERIKNGSKVFEIRLNDEKRQLMKMGDMIKFSLRPDFIENLQVEIIGLDVFKTFEKSFATYFQGQQKQEQWKEMYTYYSPEDEQKYGVLGIRFILKLL